MTNTLPNTNAAADTLAAIIAAGVARYQASLPDFVRGPLADVEPITPNVSAVDEQRQIQLCLSCPLSDCVGVESDACPIRIEQRRLWRNMRASQ